MSFKPCQPWIKVTLKLDFMPVIHTNMNLVKDYKDMLTNANHADVTIICNDGSVRAHKNVLTARSEYFNRMLSSTMKEGLTGVIEVKDMEMGVCQTLLEYIYSGEVDQEKLNVEVLV